MIRAAQGAAGTALAVATAREVSAGTEAASHTGDKQAADAVIRVLHFTERSIEALHHVGTDGVQHLRVVESQGCHVLVEIQRDLVEVQILLLDCPAPCVANSASRTA